MHYAKGSFWESYPFVTIPLIQTLSFREPLKTIHETTHPILGLREAPCLYKVQQNDNLWSHGGAADHVSSSARRNKATICTFCVAEAKRAAAAATAAERRGQRDRCRRKRSDHIDSNVVSKSLDNQPISPVINLELPSFLSRRRNLRIIVPPPAPARVGT